MDNRQFETLDILQILSFIIGYENLYENRIQSKRNDLQSANDKQAEYILKEISCKFEEQNAMLKKIIEVLKIEGN